MRPTFVALLLGLALATAPAANAQFTPPGYYAGGTWAAPSFNPYAPASGGYSAFTSPYGYSTFQNYGTIPTPYGYSSYYNAGTTARPYSVGPFHSVYFNPFLNTYQYQYGPAPLSARRGYTYSYYGFPY